MAYLNNLRLISTYFQLRLSLAQERSFGTHSLLMSDI